MANILSLAMKINADASGVVKNLTPAERALENLGGEAAKVTKVFDEFARGSEAAARTQDGLTERFAELSRLLNSKQLSPKEFSEQWAALQAEVRDTADAYAEGARITESVRTAEERRADTLSRLSDLLELGAISQQTYARAVAQASGSVGDDLAASERERAQAMAAASRIIQANLTPQERYDQQLQELDGHLREGRLTQEQYNRALEKAQNELDGVGNSAKKTDDDLSSLEKILKNIRNIEVFKLVASGISAIGNVVRDVASNVSSFVSSVNQSVSTFDDFSQRTGVSVESLQAYSLAAKLAGVDTEQFLQATQKLAVEIGKATPGDALDKALKGINLSLVELRALSPEQQFSEIGDAISQLPTAADRAAAAVQIFGKQGAALAPLFREGTKSLVEIKDEATKLGAIVSDSQTANIGKMNDAFDKVRATVQGIAGQVLGNLAPAVTDVTNQFLEFVKTWEGTASQGTGGTGIANAITDVLLEGASYFAGIFDEFVGNFSGIIVSAESVSSTLSAVTQGLLGLSETFRAVFNIFQLAGNALSAALGKLLEAVGGYVSNDLEEYGRELQRQAMIATEQNSRELEDAAARAGQAFGNMLTGGAADAGAAGQGAASQYLAGLRAEIARARLPEVKVQTNLGDAQERLAAYLKTAEDGGSKFFQQSVATVEQFQKMAAEGGLTADQIQVMNGFMDDLNSKLDQELANREKAAEAAAKQAEEDGKRIESLLKSSDAAAKIREDLDAVAREQARVSELLADPRATADQITAAQKRLQELEQLQDSLSEKAQAASQGFSEGFDKAFESTNNGLTSLIVKAEEFGPAGAAAAEQLRAGIELAQNQAAGGILTKEAYDLEVERQKAFFEQRIEQVKQEAEERLKTQKAVEDILFASQYGYNSERIKAAENLNLINQEIAATEERVAAARASGDREELNALSQRLQALDQAAAREQDIASGRAKAREEEEKRIQEAQKKYQEQQQKAQEEYAKEQQRIFEEQRKAAEAEAKRQEERLRKLNTLGDQTINAQDIRTTEGAALVLNLAAGAQDPRLIQERLQTKLLEKIAAGIGQAADNYFNTPVAIVGYARLTGE